MTGASRVDRLAAIERAFTQLAPADIAFEVAGIGPRVIDPREAALVAGAVEKRRREFATGRWCAARALARVGAPAGPILRGALHEPLWPSGFTGSITHHEEVAVAAACPLHGDRRAAIGIDLADCSDLEPYLQVLPLTRCDADELGFVRISEPIAAAYLFSMKEAAVKCLSPMLRAFIELSELTLSPADSGCHVEHAGTRARVFVRSARVDGFIVTFGAPEAMLEIFPRLWPSSA